ncbi:hypothetical protein SLE2022_285130 [Rubroshorea leprosula]
MPAIPTKHAAATTPTTIPAFLPPLIPPSDSLSSIGLLILLFDWNIDVVNVTHSLLKVELNFQTVLKRGIAMEQATDALIQLIKDHGRWVEPPTEE